VGENCLRFIKEPEKLLKRFLLAVREECRIEKSKKEIEGIRNIR